MTFFVTYKVGCDHGKLFENDLKMIPSVYCWVDNRFVNIAKGVVKSLKYHQTIDWPSVIGMTTCS